MDSDHGRLLVGILDAVEDAAPVEAVEAVIGELAAALNARTVSFLIADLSGRALVRLAHVPLPGAGEGRRAGDEVATVVPFDGGRRAGVTHPDGADPRAGRRVEGAGAGDQPR